jgi:HEAT repeat protein
MPEIKVQCPQCQVTVRLASIPVGKSAITCPKCQGKVPLTSEPPAPPKPPRPKRRGKGWSDLAPVEDRGPLFGGELWGALGMIGLCIPLAIIAFFGSTPAIIGIVAMWIVLITLSFWGGIWMLVVAFQEDATQGILCLFVPFYSLYYLVTRFGDCYRPFTVQMSALLVIPFLVIGAIGFAKSKMPSDAEELVESARTRAARSNGGRTNFPTAPPINLPKTAMKDRDDPKYLDYVLEDLRSNNAGHREDATRQLTDMRPGARKAEIVKALEDAANDPTPGVRAGSLRALATWNGKDSMPLFLKGLQDKDHGVAHAALDFVARQKDPRAIEPLIAALPTLHGDAARVLSDFGPAAEKPLIAATAKGPLEQRREAANLLKDTGSAEAAPAMLACLSDSDHTIQEYAIRFFKRVKDERAADALAEAMAGHRNEAADALRVLGPAAEKAVRTVAEREDFHGRREALLLLKDIGTKDSVPFLREVLLKRGREQEAAKDALRSIAARFPKDFPADKPPIWEVEKVTQHLADIQSTDFFKRRDALDQLARLEPNDRRDEVLKVMEALLTDRDHHIRGKAIQIYGVWAGKDAVVKLIGLLSDQEGATREAAIKALGTLKDERAIVPLAARLPDFFDRKHAVEALRGYGVKAQVEVSKYCNNHPDSGTRQEAAKLLGAIGDKEAIPCLQRLINQKQDKRLAEVAFQAMAELKVRIAAEEKSKEEKK